MGRTVVYDESIISKICSALTNDAALGTGLLIGQSTDQKDIVIHVACTPKQENDSQIKGNTDNQPEAVTDGSKSPKSKSSKNPPSSYPVDLVDEGWICQHAKQVTRMLPGGLEVLGIFVVASPELMNASLPKLKQVLFSMFHSKKDRQVPSSEKILLQRCSVTQKFTCKTYDISDSKSMAKPADWKPQTDNVQWHQLDSRVSMDLKVPVSRLTSKHSLLKQLLSGFLPFFTNVEESCALVNGRLRKMTELLDPSLERKKGGKSKQNVHQQQRQYNIDLLVPLASDSRLGSEVTECCASMSIKGTIHCRAYVHNRSTVEEAIQALKNDVIRSLRSRCEIQCEDLLLIEEEQNDPSVIHELPRRVFAPLPSVDITVCDYLFHGDSASDSLEAFEELLNLNVLEDQIEMGLEQSPARRELLTAEETEDCISEVGEQITNTGKSLLAPSLGIIAAVLILGVSYLWLKLPTHYKDIDT